MTYRFETGHRGILIASLCGVLVVGAGTAAPGRIDSAPYGKTASGQDVTIITLRRRQRVHCQVPGLRRRHHRDRRARSRGPFQRSGAGVQDAARLRDRKSLFRRHRWTLCQSRRERPVHAGWENRSSSDQQRTELPAWRHATASVMDGFGVHSCSEEQKRRIRRQPSARMSSPAAVLTRTYGLIP
jgi:hypothetical protein